MAKHMTTASVYNDGLLSKGEFELGEYGVFEKYISSAFVHGCMVTLSEMHVENLSNGLIVDASVHDANDNYVDSALFEMPTYSGFGRFVFTAFELGLDVVLEQGKPIEEEPEEESKE